MAKKPLIKLLIAALILLLSNATIADDRPPTPIDMMRMMTTFLGGEISSQQIFDMGVEANMRVPIQHLGVRFVDLRTNQEMSRDELGQILGNVRQDWSYDLINRTLDTFSIPQLDSETMIDIFNAAAIASMRLPPKYIDIEFYDKRLGYTGKGGGISGSTPNKVYKEPQSKETEKAKDNPSDKKPPYKSLSYWDEAKVVNFLVEKNVSFKPTNNNEVILPFAVLSMSVHHLKIDANESIAETDFQFVDHFEPFYKYYDLGRSTTPGEEGKIFIGLLHLKTTNRATANNLQERFKELYQKTN